MTVYGTDSEFRELSSVMLHIPGIELDNYPDPQRILHLASIDCKTLMLEFAAIVTCFEEIGISVNLIESSPINEDEWFRYNMMYCRDLFFMTPYGAIAANMANSIRSQEPLYARRAMEALGIPLLHMVSGEGRFEGADALWLTERLVAVGVGNRTNHDGYEQVRRVLEPMGVSCVAVPSHQVTTQHLLGSVQIVDGDLVMVRHEITDPEVIRYFRNNAFEVVNIPENREVATRQAMNIVTIAPRTVIMTSGCPETSKLFQKAGLRIAAELDLTQLMRGAGGLACATGILARR